MALKHGMFGTRTYQAWQNMKRRCDNSNYPGAPYYQGISYEPAWAVFENFLADMGECPVGKELDREDNSKGYYKSNCRFVTHSANCQNRRNAKLTLEKARLIKGLLSAIKPGTGACKIHVLIGDLFGVGRASIHSIAAGNSWRNA